MGAMWRARLRTSDLKGTQPMQQEATQISCFAKSGASPARDSQGVPCKYEVRADADSDHGEVHIEFGALGHSSNEQYPFAVWMTRQKAADLIAQLSNVLAARGERTASYLLTKPSGEYIIDEFRTGHATFYEARMKYEGCNTSLAMVNTCDDALAIVTAELDKGRDGPAPKLSSWQKRSPQ
ncbi:hypothetical protein AYO47_00405 [Planctomyces sp. SCGC AG-212-M04]|nr:hypothetical protein AYO47_00405 [Planctomyces sp. SCGC AG-212-M04]